MSLSLKQQYYDQGLSPKGNPINPKHFDYRWKNSVSFFVISLICSSVKYSLNFSKILEDFFNPPSSAENPQKYEFSKSCGVKSPENKILEYKS